jgi:predicted site-specific integrase-resolvase
LSAKTDWPVSGSRPLSFTAGTLGVDVVVLEDATPKEFEQEFADDIIALVASYSGRMYGRRGGRKKKVKTDE